MEEAVQIAIVCSGFFIIIIIFFFSLEEECEAPLCTAALMAKNRELQSDMKKVTTVFEKIQNYINLLALPSKLTCNSSALFCFYYSGLLLN